MSDRYGKEWSISSAMHSSNGDYEWAAKQLKVMAGDQLGTGLPILDLGTGDGSGILAIQQHACPTLEAICIERNAYLVARALENFRNANIHCVHCTTVDDLFQSIRMAADPRRRPYVHLLEGDILSAPNVGDLVASRSAGDEEILLATVWLFGDVEEGVGYRERVMHHLLRQYARQITNGLAFNIIDRVNKRSSEDMLKAHYRAFFGNNIEPVSWKTKASQLRREGVLIGDGETDLTLVSQLAMSPRFRSKEKIVLRI